MKKIYLVKKNPELPAGRDNWTIMNSYEFAMFMKTPEGQKRRPNFGQLDGCEVDDVIIVAECGEESASRWRTEKDRADYLREQTKASGFTTCSFSEEIDDGLVREDIVADPLANVEMEIIFKLTIEDLRKAVASLTEEERDLIQELFLNAITTPEWKYGENHGISQQAVHKRKQKVLDKLKKMLS